MALGDVLCGCHWEGVMALWWEGTQNQPSPAAAGLSSLHDATDLGDLYPYGI